MGQNLPLPEQIPVPNPELANCMTKSGIKLHQTGDTYIKYDLPGMWQMVNDSSREDLPRFHIIDADGNIRYTISGAWKGTYDNELRIHKGSEKKFMPKDDEIIPSETSGAAMAAKFSAALDLDLH